jgi:hypothetical protein
MSDDWNTRDASERARGANLQAERAANEVGAFCPPLEISQRTRAMPLAMPPVPASAGITGYRPLTAGEIHWINRVKEKAQEVGYLLDEIRLHGDPDPRWLAIGKTHLQQGFMAIGRAIAKPEGF